MEERSGNQEGAEPAASSQLLQPSDESTPVLVAGVGASAGGLEAVSELLRNLPADTGMAFVVVQHLDPHHESILADLLANHTAMPVEQVHGDLRVNPDHVYVIAPNATMVIVDGILRVSRPVQDLSYQRRPIDAFFVSLARNMRNRAIGVILSGAASDGTLGFKAIKAEGGITFAQDGTAKFDGMPRSAIAAGVVDFVLDPPQIARELTALARHPIARSTAEQLFDDSAKMAELFEIVRRRSGVDFRLYKQATIHRRLARRLAVQGVKTLPDYLDILRRDQGETDALFDDLLIKVTEFFRDAAAFEALKEKVFPALTKDGSENEPLRIWVPGSSTGEEIYSIAVCLLEFLEARGLSLRVQMFGTDANERVIEKARTGVCDDSAVSNVSPERLRRFFTRSEFGYQVNRQVREMCVFSRHVLGVDPPLSRMDMVSCRNLLIYFAAAMQQKVIDTLAYAVRPAGYLLVGPSENTGRLSEFFEQVDDEHRIYAKRPSAVSRVLSLIGELSAPPKRGTPLPPTELHANKGAVHAFVDRMLLSHYGPSGVVIDKDLRIIEFRGNMNPYLQIREGDAQLDLLQSVRDDLAGHLRAAISEAHQQNATIRLDDIQVRRDQAFHFVRITVIPVSTPAGDRYSVILFENLSDSIERAEPADTSSAGVGEARSSELDVPGRHIDHLERELRSTRDYLQSTIEELRSTNEEALSANEELQSNNEELQTTKEELQASNEELATMNAEVQSRNALLGTANDDLVNLLDSIYTPIVMVGNDMCIRRFTPAAERHFRLRPIDVGRPVSDFKPQINVPNLDETLRDVLRSLKIHEQEVEDLEGRSYLMRVRPYRTGDNRIDGAVLLLTDITDLKRAARYASAIVETMREPLVVLDEEAHRRMRESRILRFLWQQPAGGRRPQPVRNRRPATGPAAGERIVGPVACGRSTAA